MEIYKPYTQDEEFSLWYQGIEEILKDVKRDLSHLIKNQDHKLQKYKGEQNHE
jgi:hypothetical protein